MKLKSLYVFLLFLITGNSIEKLPEGFVYLNEISADIEFDLRYFSVDNFIGDTVDGYHSEQCIISREAAKALLKVQSELKSTGYGLKVFDAYRPQKAVDHFVRWANDPNDIKMKAKYYPEIDKNLLFEQGYISTKSGHTRGSTVDLTIILLDGLHAGDELDMGTSWDYFSPLSWPSSNEVTSKQKENRMLLRKIMVKYGFKPYEGEWWHFTLINEPFPDTYFNFPIK